MNTFKLRNAVLVAAIAGALAACGGGGGAAVTPTPFTGGVFDGKVTGATVVCDTDSNGTLNGSEVSATSDSSGNFTITSGCSSSIVAYGGKNADTGEAFLGKLKAPASTTNSTFVTPLTTLMKDGGLTAAEIVTALALPAGTNPTTADPSAAGNEEIHAATVAVQQIIQQTAATIMASALVTTAPSVASPLSQDLYALVASRVATHIKAPTGVITALITTPPGLGTAATVSPVLVNLIVKTSIDDMLASTSTNADMIATKGALGGISSTSVAALVAGAIVNQAETLASIGTQTGLTTGVNTLQSNTTIATVVGTLRPVLLTTVTDAATAAANSTTVTTQLAAAAAALATMSTTTTIAVGDVNLAAINTAANNIFTDGPIAAAAITAGTTITAPSTITAAALAPTNYLAVLNDSVSFNGISYTLASFKSTTGVMVSSPAQGSLDTIALTFSVVGTTPFTSTTGAAASTQASLGLEVKGSGTDARVLQMVIDKVVLSLDTAGQITATIPEESIPGANDGAKLYVYGKNTAGLTANVTLTNVAANTITTANNTVSFNAGTVLDAAIARLGTSNSVFSNIRNAKGTFNVKFALTNTDLYTGGASPVPADGASVQVTGTTAIATGKGAAGTVMVH